MTGIATRAWLRKSYDDFATARCLYDQPFGLPNACFHIQQSVEKLLKAILVDLGEPEDGGRFKTHSIMRLLDILSEYVELQIDEGVEEAAATLTAYEASTRYPGSIIDTRAVTNAMRCHNIIVGAMTSHFECELPTFRKGDFEKVEHPEYLDMQPQDFGAATNIRHR